MSPKLIATAFSPILQLCTGIASGVEDALLAMGSGDSNLKGELSWTH